jgi:ribulose bisphosphate carboxylase small subunit
MSYYISPRFLNKLSVHITKNYLPLPQVKVPLILGIHGRKGEGKTFQCQLVFERMGVQTVMMSAGELESPDAGDPARLIRVRYREAAELVRVRGKMAILMINDIDAGAGRVDQYTQYTVNTQLVYGTLMNIADDPTNVQLPGSYEADPIQRIPVIVTGNDFSTLYAPLVRDGRMEKFYWEPNREDRIGVVAGIFQVDRVAHQDIETLVDTFPTQSIDFFGAVRSRLYDQQVQHFIQEVGLEKLSQRIVNSKQPPPDFRPPDFSLNHLIAVGNDLVQEQKRVQDSQLVQEYNKFSYNRRLGETSSNGDASYESAPSPLASNSQPSNPQQPAPPVPTAAHHPPRPTFTGANPTHFFRAYDPAENSPTSNGQASFLAHSSPSSTSPPGQPSSTRLTPALVTEANRILTQGHKLGIEYVDARRFRTGSWNSYGTYLGDGATAIAALETCLNQHPTAYVRLVNIDPVSRRRVMEQIVQRP